MRSRFDGRTLAAILLFAGLTLLLGWTLGGQAALRRLDPAFALPTMPLGALLFAWIIRDAPRRAYVPAAATGAVLVVSAYAALAAWAAAPFDLAQLAAAGVGAFVAMAAGHGLVRLTARTKWPRAAYAALSAGLSACAFMLLPSALVPLYASANPDPKPRVTMLTSLPIVWGGGSMADVIGGRAKPDPAFTALERGLELDVRDTVPPDLPPGATLLLLHPYALSPRDLVTIDAHVRGGGRALMLADALSSWEPPYGLGDPRNPPVTSLLTPLLDHWGIGLEAPVDAAAALRRVRSGPAQLQLLSAGRFARVPPGCRAFGDGVGLRCMIGKGQATLLADADMLAAPMWSADGAAGAHASRSDNIDWLIAEVRRLAGAPPARRAIFAPVRW